MSDRHKASLKDKKLTLFKQLLAEAGHEDPELGGSIICRIRSYWDAQNPMSSIGRLGQPPCLAKTCAGLLTWAEREYCSQWARQARP